MSDAFPLALRPAPWPRLWGIVSHYQDRVIERLREQLAEERARRQDELREMATGHNVIVALAEKGRLDAIQLAETRRIDANRASDAAATVLANQRAELTALTLAERVDTTAKTTATQVEQTKIAAALAVDATTATLGGRIKPLEDARYESGGAVRGRTDVTKVLWAAVGVLIPIVLYILTRPGIVPTP